MMRLLRLLTRFFGVLVGVFLLLSGVLDIVGFMPHSVEPQLPWTGRLLSTLPSLAGGMVLLIPMRQFAQGIGYTLLSAAYVILSLAATVLAIGGVIEYIEGSKHWAILPTVFVLLAIACGNWLVLRHARRHAHVAT